MSGCANRTSALRASSLDFSTERLGLEVVFDPELGTEFGLQFLTKHVSPAIVVVKFEGCPFADGRRVFVHPGADAVAQSGCDRQEVLRRTFRQEEAFDLGTGVIQVHIWPESD